MTTSTQEVATTTVDVLSSAFEALLTYRIRRKKIKGKATVETSCEVSGKGKVKAPPKIEGKTSIETSGKTTGLGFVDTIIKGEGEASSKLKIKSLGEVSSTKTIKGICSIVQQDHFVLTDGITNDISDDEIIQLMMLMAA